MWALALLPGCGGGGGGGGGAGGGTSDTTSPSIAFTAPASSGTPSYEADPDDLPASISVRYSDSGGINVSSFSASFSFQGVSFDITDLFPSPGSSSASTSSDISPIYWTVISKYSLSTLSKTRDLGLYGVSSGSTGVLHLLDVDDTAGVLVAAATSRNALVFLNTSNGAVVKEVSLTDRPTIIRCCPAHGTVLVAFESQPSVYIYNISSGDREDIVSLPSTPMAMALNRVASTAFVIFDNTYSQNNSNPIRVIDCSDNTVTAGNLDHLPQRITTDGQSGNRLFYAGGIGGDKGIYSYSSGNETKIASLSDLPEDLAYDSTNGYFFTADYSNDLVDVYSEASGAMAAQLQVGDQPFSLGMVSSAGKLFALNKGTDTATVISTSNPSVSSTISLSSDPVGLATDVSGGSLYILQNIWQISETESGTITASIRDSSGNRGSVSLGISVTPVSTGGPDNPTTPDG